MSQTESSIHVSIVDGMADVMLCRPERRNAFSFKMLTELEDALDGVRAREDVRLVLLRGQGGAFSTGLDMSEVHELRMAEDEKGFLRLVQAGERIVTRIAEEIRPPVLAIVDGPAAGCGLGLALACDLVQASGRATFGATHVRFGLHPDWGLTYFLPDRTSAAVAREIMWTGRVFDAHEALRLGIVDRVCPAHGLENELRTLTRRMLDAPGALVAQVKGVVARGRHNRLQDALKDERRAQADAFRSPDSLERMASMRSRMNGVRVTGSTRAE